jgi:hypothetical protein
VSVFEERLLATPLMVNFRKSEMNWREMRSNRRKASLAPSTKLKFTYVKILAHKVIAKG